MKKRIVVTLVVFCIFFVASTFVRAATTDNITGWLWGGSDDGSGNSSGLGWISLNNTNTSGTIAYGVNIPTSDGKVSGMAWSENIGWISFNEADLGGCPMSDPTYGCAPFRSGNNIKGWARFLSIVQAGANSGGWSGWIHLSGVAQNGAPYGATIDATGKLTSFGWSDELGVVSFNGSTYTAAIAAAVNGACGATNGSIVASLNVSDPFLCVSGSTVSNFSGAGPWNWECDGSNGGYPASCTANKTCTPDGTYTCPSGSAIASCDGTNAGQTIITNKASCFDSCGNSKLNSVCISNGVSCADTTKTCPTPLGIDKWREVAP